MNNIEQYFVNQRRLLTLVFIFVFQVVCVSSLNAQQNIQFNTLIPQSTALLPGETTKPAQLVNIAEGQKASIAMSLQDEESLRDAEMENKSYFERLRYELNKINVKSAQKTTDRGVMLNSAIHLTPTKMAFHVIDGGIYFMESWIRADSNPLKLIEHWETTFEPTSWFSFYVFMISQGYYIDLKSKHLSPQMKAEVMRKLMYKGMVLGSLVSTLTLDVYNSFKACQWARLDPKATPAEIDQQCDAALKTWTSRNLLNKYGPQILNLVANQLASDLTEAAVKRVAGTKVAQYVGQSVIGNVESLMLLKRAQIVLTVVPGGFYVKGIHYVLTGLKFGNFLIWDHLLRPITYKYGGNLTSSWSAMVDVGSIQTLSYWFSTRQWKLNEIASKSDDRVKKYPEAISDFSLLMSEWRRQLNLSNEEDFDGWVRVQNSLINQIQYVNAAYRKVADLALAGPQRDSLPFIPLPLYGVNPGYDEKTKVHYNQYILNNKALEQDQLVQVAKAAAEFEAQLKNYEFILKREKDYIYQIIEDLKSQNLKTVAKGLYDLNVVLGSYSPMRPLNLIRSTEALLIKFRERIGSPNPILDPGIAFSYAFDALDTNRVLSKAANIPKEIKTDGAILKFENSMSYVIYNMICGPDKATVEVNSSIAYLITIPNVVARPYGTKSFCQNLPKFEIENLTSFALKSVNTQRFFSEKLNGQAPMEYLMDRNNLQSDFHGYGTSQNLFGRWWNQHEKTYVEGLKKFDEKVLPIVEKTLVNYSDIHHINLPMASKFTILSDYLPKTIKESLIFELRVLLKIFESYSNRNQNVGFVLKPRFIKQIANDTEIDNHQFNFELNKDLSADIIRLRTEFLKKYDSIIFEMEIPGILKLSNCNLDQNLMLSNLISNKIKNLEFKEPVFSNLLENQDLCGPTNKIISFFKDRLNSKSPGFLKEFLMLLVKTKLYLLKKAGDDKESIFLKQAEEISAIEQEISKKHSFKIFEYFVIELIEQFQSKSFTFKQMLTKKQNAELYLQIIFGNLDDLESYKQSKDLEKRFMFAIFEGLNGVINQAARYSTLAINLGAQLKIPQETLMSLKKAQLDRAEEAKSLPQTKGFKK